MPRYKQVVYSNMKFDTLEPSQCPHCGLYMEVATHSVTVTDFGDSNTNKLLVVVYKCVSESCAKYFFTVYIAAAKKGYTEPFATTAAYNYPEHYINYELSELNDIAPIAMKTYSQSMTAKARGMDELAGMGLRKAVDYLLYEVGQTIFPEYSEFNENPKTTLSQRIDKYIDSRRLKDLAEACAWLGNDFTHPVQRRKFIDTTLLEKLVYALFYHVKMLCAAYGAKSELERGVDS